MKSLKMAKNKANTRSAVLWVIIFTHNVRIGQTVSGASLARSRHVSVGVLASSDPSAPAYETKKKGTPLVRSTRVQQSFQKIVASDTCSYFLHEPLRYFKIYMKLLHLEQLLL